MILSASNSNFIKNAFFIILIFTLSFETFAQIKGTIKDINGQPLAFVNIYIENTYIGTTSNEKGHYELNTQNLEKVPVIFQYLGFKTQKHILEVSKIPLEFDVVLIEENYNLSEVVISSKENPANPIMRNAIAARKFNSEKKHQILQTKLFFERNKYVHRHTIIFGASGHGEALAAERMLFFE
jgi:hypothetical protein